MTVQAPLIIRGVLYGNLHIHIGKICQKYFQVKNRLFYLQFQYSRSKGTDQITTYNVGNLCNVFHFQLLLVFE